MSFIGRAVIVMYTDIYSTINWIRYLDVQIGLKRPFEGRPWPPRNDFGNVWYTWWENYLYEPQDAIQCQQKTSSTRKPTSFLWALTHIWWHQETHQNYGLTLQTLPPRSLRKSALDKYRGSLNKSKRRTTNNPHTNSQTNYLTLYQPNKVLRAFEDKPQE